MQYSWVHWYPHDYTILKTKEAALIIQVQLELLKKKMIGKR